MNLLFFTHVGLSFKPHILQVTMDTFLLCSTILGTTKSKVTKDRAFPAEGPGMPFNLRRALTSAIADHAFPSQGYNYATQEPPSSNCSNVCAGTCRRCPRSCHLYLAAISIASVQHSYLIMQGAQALTGTVIPGRA